MFNKNAKQDKKVFDFKDNWEVEIDTVEDCSKSPKEIEVLVSQLAKCKIDALMKEYKNLEWLAYLIGKDMVVEDIFIPKQEISSTTIDDVVCPEYNTLKIIGVIHSHNNMGTNFSPTDNDWINQNHNISICISNNSINGQVRWKTPCGALKIINAVIISKIDINFDDKKFIDGVKSKIKEKSFNYEFYNNYNQKIVENFFTKDEKEIIEKEVEELNFDNDKSLLEELKYLDGSDNLDDKENN